MSFDEIPVELIMHIFEYLEHGYKLYDDYRTFKTYKKLFSIECKSETYEGYIWEMVRQKKNFYIMQKFDWKRFPKYYFSKYCYYIPETDKEMSIFKFRNKTYPMDLVNKKSDFNLLIKNPSFTPDLILFWKDNIDPYMVKYSPFYDAKLSKTFKYKQFKVMVKPQKSNRVDFKSAKFYSSLKWEDELVEMFSKQDGFNWKIMSDYLIICKYNLQKYPEFKPSHKNKSYRPGYEISNRYLSQYL